MQHDIGQPSFAYHDRYGNLRMSTPRPTLLTTENLARHSIVSSPQSAGSFVDHEGLLIRSESVVSGSIRSKVSAMSNGSALSSVKDSVLRGQEDSLFKRWCEETRPKRKYDNTKRRLNMKGNTPVRDKKRKKSLSPEAILSEKNTLCCNMQCMQKISIELFQEWKQEFVPMSQTNLNNIVMDVIKRGRADTKINKKFFYPLPTGSRACTATTCKVYNVSVRHFGGLAKLVKEGQSKSQRFPATIPRGFKTFVIPWINAYAERYGNKMPDKNVIEISAGNKFQISAKFMFYCEEQGITPPSLSTFYKWWPKHIKIPKTNSFTKCDTCVRFKMQLGTSGVPFKTRAKWMSEFDTHLDRQMAERQEYYRRRNHAKSHPEEAWCLMVDGMAQFITNLPKMPGNDPKSLFGKKKYDLHVVGVMFHGGVRQQVFVHDSTVPGGPNMTIQCIWNAIVERSASQRLPPILYLQLDNTASDNKNHHVLEFGAWLVEQGYFQEVFEE